MAPLRVCAAASPTFCLRPNGCKWRGLLDENVWKMICNQVGCRKTSGLDTTASVAALGYRCVRIQMRCGVCVGLDASDGPLDAQCVVALHLSLWSLLCVSVHSCNCCTLRATNPYTRSIMAFELGHGRPASKHRMTPPQGPSRSSPLRSLRCRSE
jgi:hypothetical protein